MKAALITAIVIVLGFAYYLFSTTSEKRSTRSSHIPTELVNETVTTFERRIAQDKVRAAGPENKAQPSEDRPEGDVEQTQDDPESQGPFEVSLGQHTVHFRNHPGFAMKLRLGVVVENKATRKEVLLSRRKLTRMLYFLGSKRRIAGVRGDAGRDRLIRDLSIRFANVIRSGQIESVQIDDYEIIEVPKVDIE
ncbi:MAG: hypothetical protein CMH52_02135 [Myxococcales bacterium]|nr:hypothetical protein [Myxococcales bacterium]|tara:strand:+ start:1112 stop:1690 length:579 start_codon:yes stop_codon:yes gene_type:complete